MPLTPGSRLGPYEISAAIGAGGMGEVYRARDTRLGRDVAIKVLPQHLSGDPGRRERFEREARVVSALNHPHICTLFDIGSQATPEGAVDYLVMEFIEGETLADRVVKGALSGGEVLRYAIEIADALDKAHRQGVVHRDLKPANVMLTKNGAKLLDFGLAKLRDAEGGDGAAGGAGGAGGVLGGTPSSGGSRMATRTRDLTTAGTLLGTFQYMAPEQLEGREADARTDIFAFGALVFEMATGRRAFEGRSQASLIAAILKEEPRSISELQPVAPTGLDRVVRACLAKDPDDRVQTARDVRMQLEWVADGSLSGGSASGGRLGMPGTAARRGDDAVYSAGGVGGSAAAGSAARAAGATAMASGPSLATGPWSATDPSSATGPSSGSGPWPATGPSSSAGAARRRGGAISAAALGGLLIGLLTAGIAWWMQPAPAHQMLRVNLELPPRTELDGQNNSLALSPDGRILAYVGSGEDGKLRLWVRRLDSLQPQPLPGTEGASYPFWSPDSAFVGFFADLKLKKVQALGGTVQTLCDAPDGRGASWSKAGMIAFAPNPYGGLEIVPAAGGSPATLTTPSGEGWTQRLPHFLPDGKRLLFFASKPGSDTESGIYWLDIDTKKDTLLTKEHSEGLYVAPGYLVFVREGNLMAQPLDAATLKLTGEAVPIAERVQFNPSRWTGGYAFSESGLLAYQSGVGMVPRRLTWIGSDGKEQGTIGEPANIVELVLAPDQRHAVATVLSGSGASSLWTYDLVRGIGSRFTFSESDNTPIWSPDNRQIAYVDGPNRVFIKAADGASEPRKVLDPSTNRTLTSWAPDGSGIFFWVQMPKTGTDIYFLPTTGAETTPRPILTTPANERHAVVSPDGRWLLYSSDESGRAEAYVASYPSGGGKWQVSSAGGGGGIWVDGGRRIVYGDLDGKAMTVDVAVQGGNLTIGAPRVLFAGQTFTGPSDITRDGQRALVAKATVESGQSPLVLVTDWAAGLRKP